MRAFEGGVSTKLDADGKALLYRGFGCSNQRGSSLFVGVFFEVDSYDESSSYAVFDGAFHVNDSVPRILENSA